MKTLKGFKAFYRNNGWEATAVNFGLTKAAVRNMAFQSGVKVKKSVTIKLRSEKMKKVTTSTPAIDRYLKKHYLTINVNQLSIRLKRSETFVKTRMRQLDLVVPREIIEQRILSARIKPGHVPINKGKKWDEYVSKDVQERMRKTTFKKGGLPPTTLYDGAITTRYDKDARRYYKWIRLAKGKWQMLHVNKWIKKHGHIPEGMIVVFKNKDSMKVTLKNLELITLEENMRRNTRHQWPAELQEVIKLSNKINRKLNEKQDRRPEKSPLRAA